MTVLLASYLKQITTYNKYSVK